MEKNWYVVYIYFGYENKVKVNLEKCVELMGMLDKIFCVIVLEEEEIEVKNGKIKIIKCKVFFGYVLVEIVMIDDFWYVVCNIFGVIGFVGLVGFGLKLILLFLEEVDCIFKSMGMVEKCVEVDFEIGEIVMVKEGLFVDFFGKVDEMDNDKGKVKVMVNMFGCEMLVEVDFN